MKHSNDRQMQFKVASNFKLHSTIGCVYLYTCTRAHMYHCIQAHMRTCIQAHTHTRTHVFTHTCIIVYNDTSIPGSMYTTRAGAPAPSARRPVPATEHSAHPGPYYARGSWKLLQELELEAGAENKMRSWKLEAEAEIKCEVGVENENKRAT